MDFEKAIQTAIEQLKISRKKAISELMVFMCGFGSVEDFRDFINFYIKEQEEQKGK